IKDALRCRLPAVIDELLLDLHERTAELHVSAAAWGDGNTGGSQMALFGAYSPEDTAETVLALNDQLYSQLIGKAFDQGVFETGQPFRAFIKGSWAVTWDDPQLAFGQDSLKCVSMVTAVQHQ